MTDTIVNRLRNEGCQLEITAAGNAFEADEAAALCRHYVGLLGRADPAANDELVATFRQIGDASLARYRLAAPLACKKGCAWCCYQHVSVTGPEIFQIARVLRADAGAAATLARLEDKLANADWDPARDFDMRNPCAFLVKGACSIHAERPMICRIYVSLDVQACLRQLAQGSGTIPFPASHKVIRGWLMPGLWAALEAAGLPVRDYELTAGLLAVLRDPGIEARWYRGDDAMAHASGPHDQPDAGGRAEMAQWRAMAGV
jgi:cytochrome c551/c552